MNIVDLLVTIVVVTILVTIILAVVTYIAYKLRLSREPATVDATGPQYFVLYPPPNPPAVVVRPTGTGALTEESTPEERVSAGVAALEAHATEA